MCVLLGVVLRGGGGRCRAFESARRVRTGVWFAGEACLCRSGHVESERRSWIVWGRGARISKSRVVRDRPGRWLCLWRLARLD